MADRPAMPDPVLDAAASKEGPLPDPTAGQQRYVYAILDNGNPKSMGEQIDRMAARGWRLHSWNYGPPAAVRMVFEKPAL